MPYVAAFVTARRGANRLARALRIVAVFLILGAAPVPAAVAAIKGQDPSRKAPAAGEPIELRLPPDLIFDRTIGESGAVIFRHTTHTAFAGGQCVACHPQPFKILHPTRRTNHEEMNAGRSCGMCHDGRKAFGTGDQAACQSCHIGLPKKGEAPSPAGAGKRAAAAAPAAKPAAPAVRAGPGDVRLAKSAGSPGSVTFRHATHGGAKSRCDQCHPALFAMKSAGAALEKSAMYEGKTCGACHDGKKAFGVDDAAQCQRCHAAGGANK
jgi:c(7)-type cytochrome triheme protein